MLCQHEMLNQCKFTLVIQFAWGFFLKEETLSQQVYVTETTTCASAADSASTNSSPCASKRDYLGNTFIASWEGIFRVHSWCARGSLAAPEGHLTLHRCRKSSLSKSSSFCICIFLDLNSKQNILCPLHANILIFTVCDQKVIAGLSGLC